MAHIRLPRQTSAASRAAPVAAVEEVDTAYLETLLGYNARRAALAVIEVFLERMAVYELQPVDFSVLSLIAHNPGITSRQLCTTLGILPPNLVGIVNGLANRELVTRQPHPRDGRAMGLHLTARPAPSCRATPSRPPPNSRPTWPVGCRRPSRTLIACSRRSTKPAGRAHACRVE